MSSTITISDLDEIAESLISELGLIEPWQRVETRKPIYASYGLGVAS